MHNNIINDILPQLENISKFFKFNRQIIKKEIIENLEKIDDIILGNSDKIKKMNKQIKNKDIDIKKVNKLNNELKTEKKEVYRKFNLTTRILNSKAKNLEYAEKFESIIKNDFLEFANSEKSLAEEAEVVMKLQEIKERLDIISAFSEINNKTIVAIGGGFSAGKSTFLNSFIEEKEVKLPVGTAPKTAIPTYIVENKLNQIAAYSNEGGKIILEKDIFNKLSHAYLEELGYNLKKIMPYMTINTPLNKDLFENICLIDTPGYNPGRTSNASDDDKVTSENFLNQSDYIIWLVDIGVNGTIPKNDLIFLENMDNKDKKIYIIANKAGLKSNREQEEILEEFEKTLNDELIDFEGISCYDSVLSKEYSSLKLSLIDFLKKINNPLTVREKIIERVKEQLKRYDISLNREKQKIQDFNKTCKSLKLDLMEMDFYSSHENIEKRLDRIAMLIEEKEIDKQLSILNNIESRMINIINNLFDNLDTA